MNNWLTTYAYIQQSIDKYVIKHDEMELIVADRNISVVKSI